MINFELSEEQRMIRETIAAFARDNLRPAARAADESGTIPDALVAKCWELGLVRSTIPEAFGGDGDPHSAVTGALVAEELAWGDLAIALHSLSPRLLALPLMEMGTADQREHYLKLLAGDQFVPGSAALMEPAFDFDPAAMRTTVRGDAEGYVINGIKCLVPLVAESETVLIYAAADPETGLAGVEALIVPCAGAGLTISERERNMGLNGLATFELSLKDCRVPGEARLGGPAGIDFTRLLSQSRVALAAMAVGVGRAAFDYARDYARERKAFGVPIASKQAIAFMLADMALEVDAMRLLLWEAAAQLDKGRDALVESYQARNYSAASVLMIADNAVQILGGHGYIREHPVEMWLRNARAFAMLDGLAMV